MLHNYAADVDDDRISSFMGRFLVYLSKKC